MESYVLDTNGNIKRITATSAATTETTITATGNIDDLDFSNANLIRMNNATLATIRGLKAGTAGQRVTIVPVGAGQVDFANQNGGSLAANRLNNFVTSLNMSLAGNLGVVGIGAVTYQYDGISGFWRMVAHDQGGPISYSAAWSSLNNPQPSVGNGSFTSVYTLQADRLIVLINLTAGTTTTFGTGEWRFMNPGTGVYAWSDMAIANNAGMITSLFSTAVSASQFHLFVTGTSNLVDATHPAAWASGDVLTLAYEVYIQ